MNNENYVRIVTQHPRRNFVLYSHLELGLPVQIFGWIFAQSLRDTSSSGGGGGCKIFGRSQFYWPQYHSWHNFIIIFNVYIYKIDQCLTSVFNIILFSTAWGDDQDWDSNTKNKWRHERSSRLIRNLSNCEREAWKKFWLQRDSNPWPLRYRCSNLPTELWSHNCWEQVNFSGSIMPLRVIQHYSDWVCTAVMSKWRHERSSRLIRNLSNCEREAWKKFWLQRDSNPWPLRYRCSALPTELWSHNCWEQVNFSGSFMPLRVIQHYSDWVCTAVMSKWRHERSSRLIRNLSNCEREAWKKFWLQRDSNPWPLRYRCSALPTELWSHNCWEQVNFSGSIMPHDVIYS